MTPEKIAAAAEMLIAARRDPSRKIPHLPEHLRPADRAEALALQHHIAEQEFAGIGGWKVGLPSPDFPTACGALPLETVFASPVTLSSVTHILRGIEAEVSFRIAENLPPRATPYTSQEIIAAISSAHPAIEVLESRYVDVDAVDPFSNLADTQSHGGFVHGPGVADWRDIDFAAEVVEQYVDGELQKTGRGRPAENMIAQIVWMANVGAVWAGGLKTGQFVTCGSWTGKDSVGPDAHVRVRFPSLGEVSVAYRS